MEKHAPEKMVDLGHHGKPGHPGQQERDFVGIVEHHVDGVPADPGSQPQPDGVVEKEFPAFPAYAPHQHAAHVLLGLAAGKGVGILDAAETVPDQAHGHLMQMHFGAAGFGIAHVAPIHQQHAGPIRGR